MNLDDPKCFKCNGNGFVMKKQKFNKLSNEKGVANIIQVECKPCNGLGIIKRTKKMNDDGSFRKKNKIVSYPSFQAPGPEPIGNDDDIILDDEELNYLTGKWKIFQKINKHRYSTDDLVTTWFATNESKRIGYNSNMNMNILDIGCGIGSVLMSNSWSLPFASCIGVEAQLDRYEMAKRSIKYNIGENNNRVKVVNGDLRNEELIHSLIKDNNGFDLITGTPPYFPSSQGGMPNDIQVIMKLYINL
jgi:hypothetical protein